MVHQVVDTALSFMGHSGTHEIRRWQIGTHRFEASVWLMDQMKFTAESREERTTRLRTRWYNRYGGGW